MTQAGPFGPVVVGTDTLDPAEPQAPWWHPKKPCYPNAEEEGHAFKYLPSACSCLVFVVIRFLFPHSVLSLFFLKAHSSHGTKVFVSVGTETDVLVKPRYSHVQQQQTLGTPGLSESGGIS